MYEWQLNLIRALQKMSNGFTDLLFKGITMFGEEIIFIALAAVIFVCFDKKFGFKLIMVYMLGSFITEILKEGFRVDRPYVLDPALGIGSETEGFSFPSGHTMTATVIYLMIAIWLVKTLKLTGAKKIWTYAGAGILIFLVAFSRIYLGQHFLTDVLMGFLVGALAVLIYLLVDQFVIGKYLKGNEMYWGILVIPAIVLVCVRPDHKNYFLALGVIAALCIGYFLEKKFVRYEVKEIWWVQLIKIAVVLGIAFAIKDGLKPVLSAIGMDNDKGPSTLIRYFLIGMWASLAFPALCKWAIPKIFKKAKAKKAVAATAGNGTAPAETAEAEPGKKE